MLEKHVEISKLYDWNIKIEATFHNKPAISLKTKTTSLIGKQSLQPHIGKQESFF